MEASVAALMSDFGLDYETYALGNLEDRCFNIPCGESSIRGCLRHDADHDRSHRAHQWDLPGLGVWNVASSPQHTAQLHDVERYLSAEPKVDRCDRRRGRSTSASGSPIRTCTTPWPSVVETPEPLTDPVGEERGHRAARLALVASTADDDVVETTFGQMMSSSTRNPSCGDRVAHPRPSTRHRAADDFDSRATSSMVVGLMAELAEPIGLLSALIGAGALPAHYSVLASRDPSLTFDGQANLRSTVLWTVCASSTFQRCSPAPTVPGTSPTSAPT